MEEKGDPSARVKSEMLDRGPWLRPPSRTAPWSSSSAQTRGQSAGAAPAHQASSSWGCSQRGDAALRCRKEVRTGHHQIAVLPVFPVQSQVEAAGDASPSFRRLKNAQVGVGLSGEGGFIPSAVASFTTVLSLRRLLFVGGSLPAVPKVKESCLHEIESRNGLFP